MTPEPNAQSSIASRRRLWALTAVATCGAGAAIGLLALKSPLLAAGAVVFGLFALASLRWPDLATFSVIFILFSNVAVVATRFHGVPKAVAAAFPLLLSVPLLRDLVQRRQRLIVAPAVPFLLCLVGVQLLGLIFARDLEVTRSAVIELLSEGLLIVLLITNAVRTPRTLRLAVWALLAAGFVSSIVPCYQQVTGSADRIYGGFGQTSETGLGEEELAQMNKVRHVRLAGTVGEQNRFSQNMLMLLPLGFFMLLGERSRRLRLLASVLTGVIGIGFLLAFSRGGAVAFFLVVAAMVAMRLVPVRHLVVVGLLALLALAALPRYWERLQSLGDVPSLLSEGGVRSNEIDSSTKRRVTEMLAAGMVFIDHPVIGVGPGMFKYYSQEYGNKLGIRKLTERRKAHSLYLELAAEGGTLGLLSFAGMVLVTLYGLIATRRRLSARRPGAEPGGETRPQEQERLELAGLVTGLLLALLAYLASALFLHLAYIRFFYLMLALAGAAGGIARAYLSSSGSATDPRRCLLPDPLDPLSRQGAAHGRPA